MPYSVSVPMIRHTLIPATLFRWTDVWQCLVHGFYGCDGVPRGVCTRRVIIESWRGPSPGRPRPHRGGVGGGGLSGRSAALQVLPGAGDRVDRAAGVAAALAGDQGADEDDALALLAGDAG